ncbi:ATP-binding protein [Streptomyces triticagri]|uniref:ATP-binding protein n=1 Tax=Streptomyces triticagri TaxID=2293568 RepID=A0A372M238_9ACTN|nr:ATP-binding protein [Streptomyces triticagri]RFU85006.1 ATP-binding protein [Streptomyces triticagri]
MEVGGRARATAAVHSGGGGVLSRRLAGAELRAVPEVRHELRALLHGWGTGELRDSAELLTCELVTNALVHSGDDARLTASVGPRGLHVEVRDYGAGAPRPPDATTTAHGGQDPAPAADEAPGTSGRGLLLVQSLADAWGIRAHEVGKSVWFDLGPASGS